MSAGLIAAWTVLLCGLVIASALFSAIEMAVFSLHPSRLKHLELTRPQFAQGLMRLLENPRRLLSVVLFADALTNLPLMILCLFLMKEVFHSAVPFWVTGLGIFAVIVLLCDLIPKLVAMAAPWQVAGIGAVLLHFVMPVLNPLSRLLQQMSDNIANALTPSRFQPRKTLSEEELETLVELSAEEGALHATESEMIQEIIKLGDKTVRDCMTPRTETFAVPDDLPREELVQRLTARRHRRVPVYADSPDNILGVLDVKQFLLDGQVHYTEMLAPPSFVPETMKALDLLRSFLHRPQGLAIIVDEFGGTEGIVTMADIVEEIISDAVPSADRVLYIEEIAKGRWLVNGSTRLDELSEHLGIELVEEGIDTIGGLAFNRLGYLPPPGTELRVGDLTLLVRRTTRKQIQELVVSLEPRSGEESEEP